MYYTAYSQKSIGIYEKSIAKQALDAYLVEVRGFKSLPPHYLLE
jgi:hypothetical protein